MVVLIAALPFAAAENTTATAPGTFTIEASIPQQSSTGTITIEGNTKPSAAVHVFVNEARQRVGTASPDGWFKFTGIVLKEGSNTIRLEAHEGETVAKKEFTTTFDPNPPIVKLDKEIPAATTQNSITVSGDVNEKVTIKWRVINRQDRTPPKIIGGLRATKIEANAVELAWDPSADADVKEYLVIRNGKRIATTTLPSYKDEALLTGKQYSYSISAVDASCNIGPSAEITLATKTGGSTAPLPALPEINLSCEPKYQIMTAGSPFSLTIPLTAGQNDIEIIFEDPAGNREVIEKTVVMDNTGPKFLETNLEELSPSYSPDIKIKGRLDEQATVFVYINDEKKPSAYEVTLPDGSFEIKTTLRTDVRIKKGATKTTVEAGEGWANKIRLEAVDLAGNKASHGPVDVDFLLCGTGTWWQARIGEAMPSILLPRMMLDGVQQIGIPFNITYVGSHNAKLIKVDVRPIPLAKQAEDEYDHNWVQVQEYTRAKGPKDLIGYVQVQFENVDPLPEKPEAGPNEKERALSGHRRGECLVPGTGCIKLFLQMEIQFQEIIELKPADPRMPVVTPRIEPRVQRICIPVEVAIDQTIPSDIIPKGLMKKAVEATETAIDRIDKILKPLTTIGEYALYGCLASTVWLYVKWVQEKLECEISSVVNKFSKPIAEAGLCDAKYGKEGQEAGIAQQQACKKCEKAIESSRKFETEIMHGICDRVTCPSAPTFQTYIKDKMGDAEPLDINPALAPEWAVGGSAGGMGGTLYAGNDCAFTYKITDPKKPTMDYISTTYKSVAGAAMREDIGLEPAAGETYEEYTRRVSSQSPGKIGILDLYEFTKGKKTLPGPKLEDCQKILRPAHPNCCGVQYQREWSSACGIGTTVGESLDTFDELKESTCLAAQQANADLKDLDCNRLWNAVAGFCESGTGQPSGQPVRVEAIWQGPLPARPGADDNAVYLFAIPAGFVAGRASLLTPSIPFLGGGGTATQYRVFAGYVSKTQQFEKMSEKEIGFSKTQQYRINSVMTAALEKDVSDCFGLKPTVRAEGSKQPETQTEKEQIDCLYKALCREYPSQYSIHPCEMGNIKKAYDAVNDIVGTPEDQYIVRPYSGLLRSIQCICLPAVISYLQMWRNVLGAFHGCFSKILLTGEGSTGFCSAALSQVICDLFFEAISCFTEKFNAAGAGMRVGGLGEVGDVLGAITGAGSEVSRRVTERYGETPIYKSLFSERKLVHAICTWAFTGTWDLNIQGLFQQQVMEIPVDTMGALTTCRRTFVSYDPTTSPSGLTTWAYRIAGGLIAGADVRYRLKLKCSSGYNCDPTDYPDGKCDCATQERIITVMPPELGRGLARKFEVVNFDAPFAISAQSQPDSDVRYDTAILEWEWTDPQTRTVRVDKTECTIRETEGGNAPAFCGLDLFSGKFRCLFGEQESGISIGTITPLLPEGQSVFALGDKLSFALDIKQKYPEERKYQNQAKKFLTYAIKDAAGNVVDATMPDQIRKPLKTSIDDVTTLPYTLSTNGAYRLIVPQAQNDITPLASFVLDQDTIARHSATGPGAVQIPQDIWGVTQIRKYVRNIRVDDTQGKAAAEKMWFSIYFPTYGTDPQGEETFTIHRINPPRIDQMPPKNAANGWQQYRSGALTTAFKQAVDKPINQVRIDLPAAKVGGKSYVLNIEFDHIPRLANVKQLEILVGYSPVAEATRGIAGCNPQVPITWTAVFTIYDADRQGNPTEQVSTDPDEGTLQQKTVTFNVQCATKDQLKAMAPPAVPQALVEAVQLRQLLEKAIADENAWKTKLAAIKPETWTPENLASSVSALKTQLAQLLADENTFKTQLESLIKSTGRTDIMPEREKLFGELINDTQNTITDLNAEKINTTRIQEDLQIIRSGDLTLLINAKTRALTKLAAPAPAAQTVVTPAGVPTVEELELMPEGTTIIMTQPSTNIKDKIVKQADIWRYTAFLSGTSQTFSPVATESQKSYSSKELIEAYSGYKWEFVS
ncbi:MAG: hypothetical protein QXT19_00915 [Candidatus Woesearchaeota archaeon]